MRVTLFGLAFISALGAPAAPLGAASVPIVEDFFGPSFLRSATISPDGTRIAGAATWEKDFGGLIVHELATGTTTALKDVEDLDINRIYWHGDDRLLFSVSKDNIYSYGLYSVPAQKLSDHIPIRLYDAIDLVGQPNSHPDRVIIWIRMSALNKGAPGPLQEIDVLSPVDAFLYRRSRLEESTLRILPSPKETLLGFDADLDGELAFAYVVRDGEPAYLYWDKAASAWKNPPAAFDRLLPLARDPDPACAWIVTRDPVAGSQLRRLDLATGLLKEPVHEDAVFDLRRSTLRFSRVTRELIGVCYQRQRTVSRWFSPKFADIQATLDARLPKDEDHVIINWNAAETRFVVYSSGPGQPGLYQVFDLETGQLSRFGETRPALTGQTLRQTKSIGFKARDGLALEGYLTTPAGLTKAKPAPLIVLVHGGPRVRDTSGFDAEVQFLASRGYAVLQPNYRGSSGYLWPKGSDDYEAAYDAMRDDVIDATRAALKSGLFDPGRVAIMGGSFGGYLSVACPVEEPGLFRCAVSICGVFDWAELVDSKRGKGKARPGEYQLLLGRLGDPRKNRAAYEAISPLRRLDRLRIPMLVAHGKSDFVVSIQQSRQLVRELKARKLPHETFYQTVAGHGFYAAADRIAFYQTLERFLSTHLAIPAP